MLADRYSSGACCEGWKDYEPLCELVKHGPLAAAKTWLQRTGWRTHGLIHSSEIPALADARRGIERA